MKLFNRVKPLASALLALLTLGAMPQAQAFNTERVMNAFKYPNNWRGHTMLISHRGIVSPGCPENSSCSLSAAARNGNVEAIELDVKSSANGTLWLFHDLRLGRMTNPRFDLFGGGQGSNPLVSQTPDTSIRNRKLLDKAQKPTGYYPVTLQRALTMTRGMVAILDLKTEADARRAARIVKASGAQGRVILKLSSSWYLRSPRAGIRATAAGLPYAVTIYGGDLTRIHTTFEERAAGNPNASVVRWINRAIEANSGEFIFVELGNKQVKSGDPLNFFVRGYANGLVATSQFIPVPEYSRPQVAGLDARQNGYVKSDSSCCARLSQYLTPASAYFPGEKWDDRPYLLQNGDWAWYDSLLTDAVPYTHSFLASKGRRKLGVFR